MAVITSSPGNSPSISTRLLRISTILFTCSIPAGQISWQARQVVQDHSTSLPMVSIRPAWGIKGDLADLVDHLHRRQRFIGGKGRASILAAFAFGAGVGVEDVLPREIRYLCRANCLAPSSSRLMVAMLPLADKSVNR